MAISVEIRLDHGLVIIRYSGRMSLDESAEAFGAYLAHPDCRPGQKQLIDLTAVTDWERDFAKLMALQARKAEAFYDPGNPTLVVAIAPCANTRKLANLVSRSWDGVDGVAYLVAESQAQALELLGISEKNAGAIFSSL